MLGKTIRTDRPWSTAARYAVAVLTVLACALFLAAGASMAEPYFSVREGYKCSKCHVNKTGGGKRTDYAKVYMATRMAASGAEVAEDGQGAKVDVGHGRLSDFFSITADLRQIAEHRHFNNAGTDNWQFGRRSECESCHAGYDGGGKIAEIYEELELMPGKASIVMGQSLVPTVTTRESFGIVQLPFMEGWLKAGVFRMPTAFRNTWDDPYLHGSVFLAVPELVGLEAVRGDGVEFGIEPGPFSVSVSVTNPGALANLGNAPPKGKRVHVNAYAVSSLGMVGITIYRDPLREALERSYTAAYLGFNLGRFTFMGEIDQVTDTDPVNNLETKKAALLGQVDFLLARGHNFKWQYEAFDPNTEVEKNISDRTTVVYEPFFTPYLQGRFGARRYAGPREVEGLNGTTIFAEMHFMY